MDILLHAYVAQNLGDDLFLSLICNRYPEHTFYLFAEGWLANKYNHIPNLRILKLYVFPKVIKKILRRMCRFDLPMRFEYFQRRILQKRSMKFIDFQIWLGGSQFVETDDWEFIIDYKKFQQKFDTPFVSISATAGPFKTEQYKNAAIDVIKAYDDICFRDKKSYEITGELCNARYEMDIVFAQREVLPIRPKKKILFSLVDIKSKFLSTPQLGTIYEKKMVEIAQYYNDNGYELCFLSCCTLQGDAKISQKVIDQIHNPVSIMLVEYSGDLETFLSHFSDAQIMVATRYHANVVALRYGLKVLPIIYEDKTRYLLDNLQRSGVELQEMKDLIVEAMDEHLIQLSSDEIKNCIESAQRQYQAIDSLIWREK